MYGKELILDVHNCDTDLFNRTDLERYLVALCDNMIHMERAQLQWWDYEDDDQEDYDNAPAHLKGTSCVQFIMTSTIVIHTLETLKKAYINIFSCKDFNDVKAQAFTAGFFSGKIAKATTVERI
jgi:S-adenosylmethionine/arginine decarboxylase-like enzyme